MKSIFCWARVRMVDSEIIVDAMLTKPGLTWADEDEYLPIASFNTSEYDPWESIHSVYPNDVFEIEIKTITGFPVLTTPGPNFPYEAVYLQNQKQFKHVVIMDDCTADQLQGLDVLPQSDGWAHVISSSISAIKYLNNSLCVRFNTGAEYVYSGVSRLLYTQFLAASSKGQFFTSKIKPHFQVTMV